ncbi:hypothetical protein BC826DRAFT_972752 [Russula brevipes]|nr:hypothetical protein BC826DRAFT_972752 [Russula brevipes]
MVILDPCHGVAAGYRARQDISHQLNFLHATRSLPEEITSYVTPYTARERKDTALHMVFEAQVYGLTDSPVGLLAWIYEKLVQWSDSYPWINGEGSIVNPEAPLY